MRKRSLNLRYLFLIISTVLALGFSNPAWTSIPQIYSITPDIGSNKKSTYVTIKGADFQPTLTVALYGGGPYITGSFDTS